jgi:hypothetical protein
MPDEQEKGSRDDAAPEDSGAAQAPEAAKKPDLRVSSHQDLGVNVSRDLNASGWLARGDRSNMSKLRFSVQAKPRDEPDPELQALREPKAPRERSRDASPPAAPSTPAPPAASAAPDPTAPPPPEDRAGGVLGRLGRLFGGE